MLQYGDMSMNKYIKRRYDIAKQMLSPHYNSKVLDIGCYDGYFLSTLDGIESYGIDNDIEALKIASNKVNFAISHDISNKQLPFAKDSFDFVVCMEVLEHLKDPDKLMVEIRRVVKAFGTVLISIPNENTIWHRFKSVIGLGVDGTGFDGNYHLHFPTIKQSDTFVKKYFKVKRKKYWVYGVPEWLKVFPGLFARGVIYECHRPTQI